MSEREGIWRTLQATAVLMVLGFLLFATREILSPVLLFLLLWALLLPFRGRAGHGAILALSAGITVLWLLSITGSLLAPFVLSVALAYILDPVVRWMHARRIPRAVAILLLAVPAVAGLLVLILVVLPGAIDQLGEALQALPVLTTRFVAWLQTHRARLLAAEIPLLQESGLLARLESLDGATVVAFLEEKRVALAAAFWEGVVGVGRGIGSVFTVLGYVALMPVLTFYLLRDWDRIIEMLPGLIPVGRREAVVSFAHESDRMIARYLRGQVTVALVIGTLTGLGLWIVGFPYAGTLGLVVTVFSVVPYLGLLLSLIPALLIALVSGTIWISLLKVVGVYGAAQLLEATVVSPRIVGESVGLHPVWVLLALALGGFYLGFVGLLVAVPAAAMGKLLLLRGIERYRSSDLFRGVAEGAEGAARGS